MFNLEVLSLIALAALIWLWLDSLKAREVAVQAARAACTAEALLLLDDTVAITNLALRRDDEGQVKLQRAYDFEFSDTGNNRLKGSVVLLGHRVTLLNVGLRMPPTVPTLH
ncbi:MAG: uncharacterized protein JWN94_1458 [Betaproteobacteria bacterium]|nr:uncharacterized protein [Betaproteobacteria bacterium]